MSTIKGTTVCNHVVGDPSQSFLQEHCPRCMGTGWYGNIDLTVDNKLNVISGVEKSTQQIRKILTENRRPSGYGFDRSILRDVIDQGTVSSIKNEIVRCFQYLKNLQVRNKAKGHIYKPSEELKSIRNIKVRQETTEPRNIIVTVDAITRAGSKFETEVTL